MPLFKLAAAIVAGLSLAHCGFGADDNAYDFTELEPIVEPIRNAPSLEVTGRREIGSDCEWQGCQRPLLAYDFRPKSPMTCASVRDLLGRFIDVTKPFEQAQPGECGYVGEVQRHTVTLAALVTPGRSDMVSDSGEDTPAEIAMSVSGDPRRS